MAEVGPNATQEKDKFPPPEDANRGGGPSGHAGPGRRNLIASLILILLILAGIIFVTVWLIYRPHKPRFRVVNVAVYDLNSTSPPFISTTMQWTVVIRNPSKRASIHYERLSVFLSYRNQAITPPIVLPPLNQKAKSTVAMSPFIGGSPIPVAAEVVYGIAADEEYGVVGMRLVIMGKLRYNTGGIKTGRYDMYVTCDLVVAMRKGFVGQVPLISSPPCAVDL